MSLTPRTPPRYVPTLTEVVTAPKHAAPLPAQPYGPTALPNASVLQEQLVHRVMQRVDMSLERRLREAVATLVLEQTRDLGPLLRQEIEAVVRHSVSEAVADELGQAQPSKESLPR